jgi:hypothetical protein
MWGHVSLFDDRSRGAIGRPAPHKPVVGRGCMSKELLSLANHPTVLLHFLTRSARYKFCDYYLTKQSQSTELLSLLDTIEHYRCVPIAELVQEMKGLYANCH